MNRLGILLTLIAALGLSACTGPAPPMAPGYYGDTITLEQLVGRVNENNDRLPTIWAREHFQAVLVDRTKNQATHIDGYGNLLYTSPNQMKLTAKNEVADLFDMGSDGSQFWLHEKHDQIFWWGTYADAEGGDADQIPVRPDLVLEILGIRSLDAFLLREPSPVLRFNNIADVYMLDWQAEFAGHWAAVKEIWYDRQTLLPKRVLLFDAKGRVALWATLSNYQRVEWPAGDPSSWPMMATQFNLYFPYTGSSMAFELSDLTLSHNGFPNAATYRMPDPAKLAASGVKVIHINENSGN